MNLQIKNTQFENWLKNKGHNTEHFEVSEIIGIVEDYFNEVLVAGIYNSVIQTIRQLEDSEEHENGIPVSDLLENQVLQNIKQGTI